MDSLPVHNTVILCMKGVWWVCAVVTTYNSEACNTDTYVSLLLLHAVVRWKGLVDRVRVSCVMCRLPPGVEQGTKLGDVLCWDFALLVVMGCWLTGARPDSITAGVPVHGRVRRRRNVCWFGVVHRKKEFTIWETFTGILGDNYSFQKCQFRRSLKTQDHNWQSDTEDVTGFENVRYIRQKDSTTNG